jgi:NAD(P)-dependent dehydrogenase (short-subunit alcohol dehydrogenase family)
MNIIITGGSRGIGRSLAWLLAEDPGNLIFVTSRSENGLKSLSESAEFKNIITLKQDLTALSTDGQTFKNHVFNHFSNIDIIINNAGSLISKKFTDMSEIESRQMMEVNFFAPATLIRMLLPLLKPGSHIVNISSMGGFQGSSKYSGLSIYSASKAALATLTECLALEFMDLGIKVNCLALGSVQTEMFDEAFPGYKGAVKTEEMAEFIKGFALNGSKYFNGKIIPVALNNP